MLCYHTSLHPEEDTSSKHHPPGDVLSLADAGGLLGPMYNPYRILERETTSKKAQTLRAN